MECAKPAVPHPLGRTLHPLPSTLPSTVTSGFSPEVGVLTAAALCAPAFRGDWAEPGGSHAPLWCCGPSNSTQVMPLLSPVNHPLGHFLCLNVSQQHLSAEKGGNVPQRVCPFAGRKCPAFTSDRRIHKLFVFCASMHRATLITWEQAAGHCISLGASV